MVRQIEQKEHSSNKEFLINSNIVISIHERCTDELQRISELIQKTNQLNYTKNRMTKEELKNLLKEENVSAAYISAKDDFCNYGIVGFYLIKNDKIVHFLFSCRILGLGIENYIYSKLGYPKIDVVGKVVIQLSSNSVTDYIREDDIPDNDEVEETSTQNRLLMIGNCDLDSVSKYLNAKFKIDKEFNTVINGHEVRTSDTLQLVYARELDGYLQGELCDKLPFMDESLTYTNKLYTGNYDVIVISLVDDFIGGIYRRNNKDYYVSWGNYWQYEKDLNEKFSDDDMKYFKDNFTFIGRENIDLFKENINKIIQAVDNSTRIIFINGCEMDIGEDWVQRNAEMNKAIDEVISNYSNVRLVDMRKLVRTEEKLLEHDNRYYDRQTYYKIAQEILNKSEDVLSGELRLNSTSDIIVDEYKKKIERKIGRGISSIEKIEKLYVLKPEKLTRKSLINDRKYISIEILTEKDTRELLENENYKLLVPSGTDTSEFEERGLIEFRDFLKEEYANKLLLIIYGNCHTSVISQYVDSCEEFREKFYRYPIKLIHTISDKAYFDIPIFKYCDVFVHQSIQKGNRYGVEFSSEELIKKMSKDCIIISIPNVYRLPICFFPQYCTKPEFVKRDGGSVFFRDNELDTLILNGFRGKKLEKEYWKTTYSEEKLDEMLERFFQKVLIREKDWDIKCVDFIKNNYKEKQLFYDPNHPTNAFLLYVTEELLNVLGILYDEEKLKNCKVDLLSGYQIPILPSVKKHFKMTFIEENEFRKNSWNKVRFGKLNMNDYIKQYYSASWQNSDLGILTKHRAHLKWYFYKAFNVLWKIKNKSINGDSGIL